MRHYAQNRSFALVRVRYFRRMVKIDTELLMIVASHIGTKEIQRNPKVAITPSSTSLGAFQFAMTTTCDVTSGDKIGNVTAVSFQLI